VVFRFPALAEFEEGLFTEVLFSEREDEALFLVEVVARQEDGGIQGLPGRIDIGRVLDVVEALLDFLVLVVKGLAVAELVEAMLERVEEEGVFDFAVGVHHGGEHVAHGVDLRQRSGLGQDDLQMVEEIVEHDVFGVEGLSDFHGRLAVEKLGVRQSLQMTLIPSGAGRQAKIVFRSIEFVADSRRRHE